MLKLEWPQLVWLGLMAINLMITGQFHGQPRGGTYNISVLIVLYTISIFILYSGGFFTE